MSSPIPPGSLFAGAPPASLLLYSAAPFIKWLLAEEYYGGTHYVWCSARFDARALGAHERGFEVPPSSNPAEIYADIKRAVDRGDRHDFRINRWKTSIPGLAAKHARAGVISADAKAEIAYRVKHAEIRDWRPVLYVVPAAPIGTRAQLVPPSDRAGVGPEYIVSDLTRDEFHLLEF